MGGRIAKLAKRVLPGPVIRLIRRHRRGLQRADRAAAWEFKREFFWTVFRALDFNGIEGDYVEFGSHGGMTFRLAYDQIKKRRARRHMWAFDSFEGLPEPSSGLDSHPEWKQGALATDVASFHRICRAHRIPRDMYTAVPGFYEETLTRMKLDAPPTDIALAYIDCDLYSSTKTVLEFLLPRLKHGMILAFDDYFCWADDRISGERRAILEVLTGNERWNLLRYRDIGWAGASFIVERADLIAR